jgi:hypothetical protein
MSRDHVIRDARELGDCRSDRYGRLVERLECIDNVGDPVIAACSSSLMVRSASVIVRKDLISAK